MKLTRYRSVPSLRTGYSSKQAAGRNDSGRITVRHQGGGHKQNHRVLSNLDFTNDSKGSVIGFEYDPRRNAPLAKILTSNQQTRYTLATNERKLFHRITAHPTNIKTVFSSGDSVSLSSRETGDFLHSVAGHTSWSSTCKVKTEGDLFARSAGTFCQIRSKEIDKGGSQTKNTRVLRLPSGYHRFVPSTARGKIGRVPAYSSVLATSSGPRQKQRSHDLKAASNPLSIIGKAGRAR